MTSEAQGAKPVINKWDCIKLESFYTAKGTINKMKKQPTKWEKMLVNYISDEGLTSKIYKELIQLNRKKKKSG